MKNTQINTQSVNIYNTLKKLRVEDDSSLPDYCSDIVRVVKTESFPSLTSKKAYVKDGTLFCEISGNVLFNVIYVSDSEGLESYSFTAEFYDTSKTDVSDVDSDSVFASIKLSAENPVCKVLSPRRISVRCDLCPDIKVEANRGFECYTKGTDTVETIEKQVSVLRMCYSKDSEFNISEEIKLPKTALPMERILSVDVTLYADDAKAGDGNVSFWGNAGISCVYIPETDGEACLQSFYQPIEIKGTIELEDASADMCAFVSLIPSAPEYEILADDLGESKVLKVSFPYTAQCAVKENFSAQVTQDIYGIGCKVFPKYDKKEFSRYVGTLNESTAIKEKLPLKKGIEALEGSNVLVSVKDTYFENGEFFVNCRIGISAIGITDEGVCPLSESFDIALHLNIPSELSVNDEDFSFDISSYAGYVDAVVENGELNVAFDINTIAHMYCNDTVTYVSSADTAESEKQEECAMFFYPSETDTLWTVGKRYGVSREALAAANGISEGDGLKRVMVIPMEQ